MLQAFFFYIKNLHVKHKKWSHLVYLIDIPWSKKKKKAIRNSMVAFMIRVLLVSSELSP